MDLISRNTSPTHRVDVTADSYGENLVDKLHELRAEDSLCDFTVSAEGVSVRVHALVLVATSDYFRAMLLGPMKESRERSVDLRGIPGNTLKSIIEFMYSGRLTLDTNNITAILDASSHLQIATALEACSNYLIQKLTFESADEILAVAEKYALKKVQDYYRQMILRNFEEFVKSERFKRTSASELCQILASDDLIVSNERHLFDYVVKWVSYGKSTRLQDSVRLMDNIRFSLLPDNVLIDLSSHSLCKGQTINLINEGRTYHRNSETNHPMLNNRTRLRTPTEMLVCTQHGSVYQPLDIFTLNVNNDRLYRLSGDVNGAKDSRTTSLDNFLFIYRILDAGGGTSLAQLLRFDPRHLSVVQLTTNQTVRIDAAFFALPKSMLLISGGMNDVLQPLDTMEVYDSSKNEWLSGTKLPYPIHSHSGVTLGDRVFISGGVVNREPSNNLLEFQGGTWKYRASMKLPRRLHQMLVHKDQIFVAGGTQSQSHLSNIHLECYNSSQDQWTILTQTMSGRSVGHFVSINGEFLSIGREHPQATESEIWRYDEYEDVWKRKTAVPRSFNLSTALATCLAFNTNDERFARCAIPR